jgi:hypothetical protein
MTKELFMRVIVAAIAVLAGLAANAAEGPTPYAGQQSRDIKSLSEQEISALLAGQGSGLAKAAELNGYPGPAHVIELAAPLGLTAEQHAASERLMNAHKARASKLGADVVQAERTLDALFAQRQAQPETVERAAAHVGQLQAALRAEHLNTHLLQTRLLSAEQVQRYQLLRGYAATPSKPADATHSRPHGH